MRCNPQDRSCQPELMNDSAADRQMSLSSRREAAETRDCKPEAMLTESEIRRHSNKESSIHDRT